MTLTALYHRRRGRKGTERSAEGMKQHSIDPISGIDHSCCTWYHHIIVAAHRLSAMPSTCRTK